MQPRLPWILSLALNAILTVALAGLWHARKGPDSPWQESTPAMPDLPPSPVAGLPAVASGPTDRDNTPDPPRFHWSQIESADYRQYIANLRAVGCPDRLIRDVVMADLHQLYERRRQTLRAPAPPPWVIGDTRLAVEREIEARLEALDKEHQSTLQELLGFAWSREAIELWNNEPIAWVLLGFLTDDQAIQVAGLVDPLSKEARRVRDRVQGILLAEDYQALEQLHQQFKTDAAAVLTPQQAEEFALRLQAFGLALSGKDVHFEAAELTGREAREVIRLSLAQSDFVRKELLDLDDPPAEREERQLAFESGVAQLLGAQRYLTFARAQDEAFREVYDFSHERQLPNVIAVKAWEIRKVAEAEAEAIRAAPAESIEPEAKQQQLHALQESTAVALTTLFGMDHMGQYLEQHGAWMNQLGPTTAAVGTRGEP